MFFKKKQRFSLRKYKIGVCSVLLGTSFIMGANQVSAEETVPSEPVSSSAEQVEDPTPEAESTTVSPELSEPVEEVTESDAVESTTAEEPVVESQGAEAVETTTELATVSNPTATELDLVVNTKVTVLDANSLTEGEKAAVEAIVREANHLTEAHEVRVANDGAVTVFENGVEVGRLTSEAVIDVLVERTIEPNLTTEAPTTAAEETVNEETSDVATDNAVNETENGETAPDEEPVPLALTTAEEAAPVVPEAAEESTDVKTSEVNLEALKAEKIALLNTYSLLSPTVKGEFVSRFQEAVDVAALNLLAEEARKAQKRAEAFPNQGVPLTTGTYFRAEPEALQAAPTEGRLVTPDVTVTSTHRGYSPTPTIFNEPGTKLDFSFGNQELHKGDYFFVETQDVPIPFPDTFRLKSKDTDGSGPVIATVERVGYESDYVKGTDSEDKTRFELKNDGTLKTMAIKYKVTFTEAVEGLRDVKASVSGNGGKATLAGTEARETKFVVKVNDKPVYTSVYSQPAWDDANAANYKRYPTNTGYQGVVTQGLYGDGDRSKIDYDTGNRQNKHGYVSMEATVYDYRTNVPGSNVGFLTETTSEGYVQLTGQVGGMPDGFKTTITSPTDANKNTYTWDESKLRIGERLPVYYVPFEELDTKEKKANADNGKLYVTPEDMYYKIESISDDKRTITLRFYGDYSKPGRIINAFKNPMEDFKDGKNSRLGIKFDKPDYIKEAEKTELKDEKGNVILKDGKPVMVTSTDNSILTVTKPDGSQLPAYTFNAVSKSDPIGSEPITQGGVGGLTSQVYRPNYDATATGVPIETSNKDQIGKGTLVVRYVDVNGKTIKEENVVIKDAPVELEGDVKTNYDTTKEAYRPKEMTTDDGTKYQLAPESDTEYTVGTVSKEGHLTNSNLRDVVASNDPNGAEPAGELSQGTKYITYVYKEVEKDVPTPPEAPKTGDVIVHYKDDKGNPIDEDKVDTQNSLYGTEYNTKDNRPETITTDDGVTYRRIHNRVEGDPEEGTINKEKTEVTYIYKKVANWIPKIPNKPEEDNPKVPYPFDPENPDSPVDPTKPNDPKKPDQPPVIPHVPGYIPNDPKGNPLEPVDPEDPTKGYVPPVPSNPGEDTYIPYVPAPEDPTPEKPGKYVPYIPKDPENPTDPSDPKDPKDPTTGKDIPPRPYDETPEDPSDDPRLPDVEGHVPVDPADPSGKTPLEPVDPNDPKQGYVPPKPVNPKEDTPIPYVPAGTVIVRYENEEGVEIKDSALDTPKSPVGTEYNTTDNRPEEITYNGDRYVRIPSKTKGAEVGKVVKGETVVTYVYTKVANWIPKIPNKPEEDNPKVPYPFDPENPDSPVDPTKPNDPKKPDQPPVIPHVPGYIPNDPKGNPLEPVDPEDPTKGYVPPVPSNPGED
ncbi:YSIRK-type signal peptide-containing protein, partial [Tuanshanicoccus lijuaniae]|nr:MucBP domain-containing protein [Aerococcaceae bacterium zg-BR33]